MESTYISFWKNEIRAVELLIRDQNDNSFKPSTAFFKVVDSAGTIVKDEYDCLIADNKIYALINTEVTSTVGEYEIIWKIVKTSGDISYTYYHKTKLNIEQL